MMDDFKPQQPNGPTSQDDPVAETPQATQDGQDTQAVQDTQDTQSTYESTPEPVQSDETVAAPVVTAPKKSGAKKWLLGGLVVLALAGLGAFAYWQWAEADNSKKELSRTQAQLTAAQEAAQKDAASDEGPADVPATSGEDFMTFVAEYNKMVAASVALTAADETAIEAAIKSYYKLSTLPDGWQIVTAYKDAEADSTGKPVNALIYWPASAEKPAGFFEVTQAKDGKWAYNEQR